VTRPSRRTSEVPTGQQGDGTGQAREPDACRPWALTLHHRSVGLEDNVRTLLDWLVDQELKRWQSEER
jgi:hypothetical protein